MTQEAGTVERQPHTAAASVRLGWAPFNGRGAAASDDRGG